MATLERKKNSDYRSREYLTFEEVKLLATAARYGELDEHGEPLEDGKRPRYGLRDEAIIRLAFRHGLRAGEVSLLKWQSVMGDTIAIQRLKGSKSGSHPLSDDEQVMLRSLRSFYPDSLYLFPTERGQSISPDAIAKIVDRAAQDARLLIKCHPHMLRHACGYWLASQDVPTRVIQEWLGHSNIQHTATYTAIAPGRFKSLPWESF